jgi:hypothetical protein
MTTDPHAIQPSGDVPHDQHITAGHGTSASGHHAEHALFPAGEIADFHQSDRGASAVVILLVTGIFITGLFLYTIVAVATYSG